jgi:hypothetical protein
MDVLLYCALRQMAVYSVKQNGVIAINVWKNLSRSLSATGKWRMWLQRRGVGEINLEFGAGGRHFEHSFTYNAK